MSRAREVAVTVGVVLVVVLSASFAIGATNTAIGSIHTTNNDFNAAQTLDNVSVANGNVSYKVGEYNVVEDDGDGVAESEHHLAGEAPDGNDKNSQYKIKPDFTANITELVVHIESVNNGGPTSNVNVRIASGNPSTNGRADGIKVKDWNPPASTGATTISLDTEFEATAGENLTVTFDTGTIVGNGDTENITISTDNDSGLTGWSGLDVSTTDAGGNITARSDAPDADRAIYVSSNHSVTDPSDAFTNLSAVTNASATVTWEHWTGSNWATEDQSSYTTAGNKSITIGNSADKWRVNVTWQNQSSNGHPVGVLSDEGLQFTNHDPDVDNGSASPTGDINDAQQTLSIDVNDSEFASTQSETVTVEFFVNESDDSSFTSRSTDTLNSNGTAEYTDTFTVGGTTDWFIWANDSYGGTQKSQTFSFTTPSNLSIREESEDHEKITSANATVMFFEDEDDDPTIIKRTTDSGELNLSGLPIGNTFIVSVQAPGYHNRTTIIDGIFDQQTVFLVNRNRTTNEVTFKVDDQTGDFGQDAQLTLQKAINRSLYGGSPANYTWTNVAGDEIGAQNQLVDDLIRDDRYRIRIESGDNETRLLGAHVATNDQVVTLTIQDVTIDVTNETTDVSVGFEKDAENNQLDFSYTDRTDNTSSIEVIIHEKDNRSNEIHNQTHVGTFGDFLLEKSVSDAQLNKSWVVRFNATRAGENVSGVYLTGNRGNVAISVIPAWVRHYASMGIILLIPTLMGGRRAETGALVATAIAGVLWWIQWLPPEVSIMSVALAATIAVGFKIGTKSTETVS